jgi:release factor glutamine methyltransferase
VNIRERYQAAAEFLAKASIPEPEACAGLLLAQVLGVPRRNLPLKWTEPFPESLEPPFSALLERRKSREPVQYILGNWDFLALTLKMAPGVLIPRFETEEWLEAFFTVLATGLASPTFRFADIGTGTGAIGLALAARFPAAEGWLCDLDAKATALAGLNLAALPGVSNRLGIVQGSLCEPFASQSLDVVVSNPPYIATADIAFLMPEVRDFESRLALHGGDDGLEIIRELLLGAMRILKPGGFLAFEHAYGQRQAILDLLPGCYEIIAELNDLENRDRALILSRT